METGTKLIDTGWNLDSVIAHLREHGASVERDNDGQIVIYTGLFEHEDGALYSD